jgi:hypothetical protein
MMKNAIISMSSIMLKVNSYKISLTGFDSNVNIEALLIEDYQAVE